MSRLKLGQASTGCGRAMMPAAEGRDVTVLERDPSIRRAVAEKGSGGEDDVSAAPSRVGLLSAVGG